MFARLFVYPKESVSIPNQNHSANAEPLEQCRQAMARMCVGGYGSFRVDVGDGEFREELRGSVGGLTTV